MVIRKKYRSSNDKDVVLTEANRIEPILETMKEIAFCLIETRARDLGENDIELVISFPHVLLSLLNCLEEYDQSQEATCGNQKGKAERVRELVDGVLGQLEKPERKSSVQYKFSEDQLTQNGGSYRYRMGNLMATLVETLENEGVVIV